MPTYLCNACGGTFTSPQRGTIYFHACPPLSVPEMIAADAKGDPVITPDVHDLIVISKGPKGPDPDHPSDADKAAAKLQNLAITRTGHVDQNIVDTRPLAEDEKVKAQVSPGAGVTQTGP